MIISESRGYGDGVSYGEERRVSMESLKKVWEAWKRIGQFIGDFIGRVILTIFYFTLFAPFGIGVRLFGDPLQIRGKARRNWIDRDNQDPSLDEARRLS